MPSELIVFSHIPKTAGQFFKNNIELSHHRYYLMRASFGYHEPFHHQKTGKVDFYRGKAHFVDYAKSLSKSEIEKVRCIAGHDAYHGIHDLFNAHAHYITFIRDPVARTVSLYNYERMAWSIYETMQHPNEYQATFKIRIVNHFLVDGKVPDFETWLHHVYNHGHVFYFTMTKYLQYLNFIDDQRDESSIEDALKKFYFVGITESFETDSAFLYDLLGVKTFAGDENISPALVKQKDLSLSVIQAIKDLNQDDMVLYECALRQNAEFKRNKQDFYVRVAQTRRRQKLYQPVDWLKKTAKNILRPVVRPILVKVGLR